jgi:hypothetical protein
MVPVKMSSCEDTGSFSAKDGVLADSLGGQYY